MLKPKNTKFAFMKIYLDGSEHFALIKGAIQKKVLLQELE